MRLKRGYPFRYHRIKYAQPLLAHIVRINRPETQLSPGLEYSLLSLRLVKFLYYLQALLRAVHSWWVVCEEYVCFLCVGKGADCRGEELLARQIVWGWKHGIVIFQTILYYCALLVIDLPLLHFYFLSIIHLSFNHSSLSLLFSILHNFNSFSNFFTSLSLFLS